MSICTKLASKASKNKNQRKIPQSRDLKQSLAKLCLLSLNLLVKKTRKLTGKNLRLRKFQVKFNICSKVSLKIEMKTKFIRGKFGNQFCLNLWKVQSIQGKGQNLKTLKKHPKLHLALLKRSKATSNLLTWSPDRQKKF